MNVPLDGGDLFLLGGLEALERRVVCVERWVCSFVGRWWIEVG